MKTLLPLVLLLSGPAAAQLTPPSAKPAETPAVKPTPAQQSVLDRIRKLRDGDNRRFGECSYRWDNWSLQANGLRTTTYSCEGSGVVDHTVGVNCGGLTINYYKPVTPAGQTPEKWAWGQWRLPSAGGEELMVASLCANTLPAPAPAPKPAPAKQVKP